MHPGAGGGGAGTQAREPLQAARGSAILPTHLS